MCRLLFALVLGCFLPLLNNSPIRVIPLIVPFWYKVCLADLALLFTCRIHGFGGEFPTGRKRRVFEIDSIPADTLDAGVFLAVI